MTFLRILVYCIAMNFFIDDAVVKVLKYTFLMYKEQAAVVFFNFWIELKAYLQVSPP